MKCVNGFEIKPMKSAAGWYMGTRTKEGYPNCRVTTNYYKTAEEAEENIMEDYRYCEENNFCSHGLACYYELLH